MKIYTKGGDRGQSSLFSGERVSKADQRLEAYGTVDEFSSTLGLLEAAFPPQQRELAQEIRSIQADLVRIGAWLATTPNSRAVDSLPQIDPERTGMLETAIDRMQAELPPLMGFILPGGQEAASRAHLARSICRRAERRVIALFEDSGNQPEPAATEQLEKVAGPRHELLIYLNRLSDYLFVLARTCNRIAGETDRMWEK